MVLKHFVRFKKGSQSFSSMSSLMVLKLLISLNDGYWCFSSMSSLMVLKQMQIKKI